MAEPAGAGHRRRVPVADRIARIFAQPAFRDAQRIVMGGQAGPGAAHEIGARIAHLPGVGRALAEDAEGAHIIRNLLDHIVDACALRGGGDHIRPGAAVLPVKPPARRPVAVGGAGLTVPPEKQDRPGQRPAALGAAVDGILVVGLFADVVKWTGLNGQG